MIAIKEVSLTPDTVNTGESVFISVYAKDISWEDIKSDFLSWQEVKQLLSWQGVRDYEG